MGVIDRNIYVQGEFSRMNTAIVNNSVGGLVCPPGSEAPETVMNIQKDSMSTAATFTGQQGGYGGGYGGGYAGGAGFSAGGYGGNYGGFNNSMFPQTQTMSMDRSAGSVKISCVKIKPKRIPKPPPPPPPKDWRPE